MPAPPTHVHRTVRRGVLAVTELKFDAPINEKSEPIGYNEAFLVSVFLKTLIDHEAWYNGKAMLTRTWKAGQTYIFDLRLDPRARGPEPSHVIHFYMPLQMLNVFADQEGCPAISDLKYEHGVGRDDPVLRYLSLAALSAFENEHHGSELLLDEILNAACAHTFGRYSDTNVVKRLRRPPGLAPWQEKRAKELMDARFDISLSQLARECGLSITQFARGFRQSTGLSPHQWLLARRIDKAQTLLLGSDLPLAQIASLCGFCTQSHMSSVFRKLAGVSPGYWRRRHE
jgi:AraC family transcriptional regulator